MDAGEMAPSGIGSSSVAKASEVMRESKRERMER